MVGRVFSPAAPPAKGLLAERFKSGETIQRIQRHVYPRNSVRLWHPPRNSGHFPLENPQRQFILNFQFIGVWEDGYSLKLGFVE